MAKRERRVELSVSERIERSLAEAAVEKRRQGLEPSRRELTALRKFEKQQEQARRWQYYASISKGDWVELSGRDYGVLNSQARRYGLPVGGRTIDLGEVARWLHNFLARNRQRLAGGDGDDPLLVGPMSPALERYREIRAQKEELDLGRRKGELLPREDVDTGLRIYVSVLRQAAETLQKEFGTEAMSILTEALDDADRRIAQELGRDTRDG